MLKIAFSLNAWAVRAALSLPATQGSQFLPKKLENEVADHGGYGGNREVLPGEDVPDRPAQTSPRPMPEWLNSPISRLE